MAPLPESNTDRAFLTYRVAGQDHTLMARYDADSATISEVIDGMNDFISAMSALVYNSLFVRFEISAEGSNVRVPATWTGLTEWGGSDADPDEAPLFWSYTGKSLDGRRFRAELFGRGRAQGDNWRIAAADDSAVAAAIAAINTESAVWLTISGGTPIVNSYANKSVAQHWVKELR